MEKVRRSAALYFVFQGLGVAAWWMMLYVWPETREPFQLETASDTSLLAFLIPDILFIAAGSVAVAAFLRLRNKFETAAIWLVTGAVSYAAIYTVALALKTDSGWLGVAMMLTAMLWSGVFATAVTVAGAMFRQAKESPPHYVLLKTYVQIVVVWFVVLVVFPYLITILEDKLGVARVEFAYQKVMALFIFAIASIPGVWAAHSMSRVGKGTPLPFDHAADLVVVGPYSYVRNPMALSGILQGFAVALFLGSPLVLVYALMGSSIWQLIFRPLEEDDLANRFGEAYTHYRNAIRCWVPHRQPYQIDGTTDSSISIESPFGRM